jgi:anti-sigma factor RsiW
MPDYTCRQFVDDVTAYLEDALDAARRASVEAHLPTCPGCRTYLDQMRAAMRTLRAIGNENA